MAQPTSSALRALALEYKSLQEEPVEGFRVKLVNEDNMFEWEVAIFGPPDTLYQGGYFKVRIAVLSLLFTRCISPYWYLPSCIYLHDDGNRWCLDLRDVVLGYVDDHPSRSFPFLFLRNGLYMYIKRARRFQQRIGNYIGRYAYFPRDRERERHSLSLFTTEST